MTYACVRLKVTCPDDDLPLVRRGFPWPMRVGCVLAGAFAVVMPLWELGRGLWPLNIASPVFAIIVGGAGYVGVQFIRAGLSGWGDTWTYAPHTIVVQRRAWGRSTSTRLSTTNVAAVEVRAKNLFIQRPGRGRLHRQFGL